VSVDPVVLLTILGMAVVTYATRAGGPLLLSRVKLSPRVEAGLNHVPGAVLMSIVAPQVLNAGLAEAVAAALTVLTALVTRSLLLAMVVGVVAVWALRQFL
jgi:uncharacterized membrane protein